MMDDAGFCGGLLHPSSPSHGWDCEFCFGGVEIPIREV